MDKEYDVENILSNIDFHSNELVNCGNGLMLTNREIEVLEEYKINYKNCKSLKEVLYEVEDLIADMDIVDEDLDYISYTISERDYYQNTNK